jgi:hypothetical protein
VAAGEPSLRQKSIQENIVMPLNVLPLNLKSIRIAGVATLATLFLASDIAAEAPAYPGNNSSTAGLDSQESLRSTRLLEDLQVVTSELHRDAETLSTFATRQQLSWQSHASYLTDVRDQINEAGQVLKELQGMLHKIEPWQQEAINRIHPVAVQLAGHTEAAIQHLNENQNQRSAPEYTDRLTAIADHAADMKDTIDNFVDYGATQTKLENLEVELNVPSS